MIITMMIECPLMEQSIISIRIHILARVQSMFISFHFLSTNCLELGLEMYRCVNFLKEELLSLRNNECQKCMKMAPHTFEKSACYDTFWVLLYMK